ncbi:hypothetical protein C8T65DRAFT_737858 [Cerioporus squamosus]|nr:hypothetical protein C8T65DRAFT_737858 [Cerioporus squamosus]
MLPKRDAAIWKSPFDGTIVSPDAGSTVVPAVDFAFKYTVSNWCESAFSPFTVYFTQGAVPPSFDNFMVSNFGLPLSDDAKSPPPTLVLPEDLAQAMNPTTQHYLSVVQEFDGCPGHIPKEFSVTSVPITVDGLSA